MTTRSWPGHISRITAKGCLDGGDCGPSQPHSVIFLSVVAELLNERTEKGSPSHGKKLMGSLAYPKRCPAPSPLLELDQERPTARRQSEDLRVEVPLISADPVGEWLFLLLSLSLSQCVSSALMI